MKVIYVSALVSSTKMKQIIEKSIKKPLQSIQKFHRLMCEGLSKNNVEVETISAIPMSSKISKKRIWVEKKEREKNVIYKYIPFINIIGIRQLCIFIGSIIMIIKNRKSKVFICDILNTTLSFSTVLLSKIFKYKCVAIVTDLPRDIGGKFSISKKINVFLQNKYDSYILLTEAMNEVVNKKNHPFIVIEGLADVEMSQNENIINNKYKERVCIYAGGLYERYGLKTLIEAFKSIENDTIRLHLYGTGELEDYIKNINDSRIKYFGVVTNDIIIKEEIKATLLINPRFSNEEYTKYSFPSKIMEYMSTGTPVLTTKLKGIPEEYFKYIFYFEDETCQGMKNKLEKILSLNIDELSKKGKSAREFVLKNKNNIEQTKKIIKLISTVERNKK